MLAKNEITMYFQENKYFLPLEKRGQAIKPILSYFKIPCIS